MEKLASELRKEFSSLNEIDSKVAPIEVNLFTKIYATAGADPGFSLGGGGARKRCQHAHYERGTELTFGRGPGLA